MKKDPKGYIDDTEDFSWVDKAVAKRNNALRRADRAKTAKAGVSGVKSKAADKPLAKA